MRKVIFIILLVILILQSGGMLVILNIKQCIVQYEMRELMENDTALFEKLVLSATDFKRSRINSKEILYKEKLYDVKSITYICDSVKLLVINDIEEENILIKIKELANNINSPYKKLPSYLKILIALNYISSGTQSALFIPSFQCSLSYYYQMDFLLDKPETPTPPPRQA